MKEGGREGEREGRKERSGEKGREGEMLIAAYTLVLKRIYNVYRHTLFHSSWVDLYSLSLLHEFVRIPFMK